MKTIIEWAELCADDTIRQQWIEKANEQGLSEWKCNRIHESMSSALLWSFDWGDYPESDYWYKIYKDMQVNHEKYLKKRKAMFHEYEQDN